MSRYSIEWYARYAGYVIRDSHTQRLLWSVDDTPLTFFSRSQAAGYLSTREREVTA